VGEGADKRTSKESGSEEDAFCSHKVMVRLQGWGSSTKAEGLPGWEAFGGWLQTKR
jgi:hypothetical protein